ncbi:hypothetical protein ACFL5O_10255 [Myxococcota bacterium]
MQRQADVLVASLRDFIAQPDYPTLVVNGTDACMTFPNRALAAFDRQDEEAYYLLYPQPCADASAYMGIVAESLSHELEILNAELGARQMAVLPDLPLAVTDARYPPVQRLLAAIDHCGQHLPGTTPIVWGLLPAELPNPMGYRALIAPLFAPETIEPWMDRHRFIVRDQALAPFLVNELLAAKNERVLVLDIDFSNERFVQGLVETAHDQSLPTDDRMNAFFQLAAVDFGFRRFPQALEKYGVCFNYFEQQGNKPMQSLCLCGAADTMRQAGRPEDALKFYQQALAVGVEDQNLAVIQQSSFGAGVTCLDLSRDSEAEGYLKHADDAAAKLFNPFAKCDAMERRGLVAWRLGKIDQAIDTWIKGKELAKQFSYIERAVSILNFLIALSRQSSLYHRVTEFEAEKAALGSCAGSPGTSRAPGVSGAPGAPGGAPGAPGGAPGAPGGAPAT